MSFSDDTRQLQQSLVRTRESLTRLLAALEQRRAAWVSVRPSVLAPTTEIEQLSHQLAREEDLRAGLLHRIRNTLPTPTGSDPARLHVNITRIAAALPAEPARELREIGDQVVDLSRRVRNETTLGQRLLRFARNAQSTIEAGPPAKANAAPGYDRRAQNVRGARNAGQFVDGRM